MTSKRVRNSLAITGVALIAAIGVVPSAEAAKVATKRVCTTKNGKKTCKNVVVKAKKKATTSDSKPPSDSKPAPDSKPA